MSLFTGGMVYTAGVDKWLDRLELVLVTLSVVVLVSLWASYVAAGILAWVWFSWWAGVIALMLPVGFLAWFGWQEARHTFAGSWIRLRRRFVH